MSKKEKESRNAKPLISIVVPAHNTERYLERCLDSLVNQTLKEIEIICIDDGSTDGTLEILEEYKKKDKRVKIKSIPQSGLSIARNTGIEMATAEYIMFCDSDDYYELETCEKILEAIESTGASVVINEINTVYEAYPERQLWDEEYYNLRLSGLQEMSKSVLQQTDVASTNKIFRRDIIDKYKIRFPEGRSYEDSYFCYAYFCVGKTVYYLHERLYNYVRHEGSIMATTWEKDIKHDVAIDHLFNGIKFFEFLKEHGIFEEYSDLFWDRFLFCENFTLTESKTKQRRQEAREVATKFIQEHKNEFYMAEPGVRDALIAINPKLFFIDSSRTKKAILKFLPTYRLQINNIWKLDALIERNNSLLKELKTLTMQINQRKEK